MNGVVPFNFNDHLVRVIDRGKEPWWVASDLAKVLGYSHVPSMVRMLDDDQKGVHSVRTLGGDQDMTIINESGLYDCVLRSKRPEAKVFRKWVTSDLLPTLRKQGYYGKVPALTVNEQVILQKELDRLVQRLERAKTGEVRETIIASIEATCQRLGRDVPDMNKIGHLPPTHSAQIEKFWAAVYVLFECGMVRNHSRKASAGTIAINMRELEAAFKKRGIELPIGDSDFRQLLKSSQDPRFLAIKTVNSAVAAATSCWVFERAVH